MDVDKLRQRLTPAQRIPGDIAETARTWLAGAKAAPIGPFACDLDYYSSTTQALKLFEGPASTHLPRVHCYFDDVIGPEFACMNDSVGELLAIDDFNAEFDLAMAYRQSFAMEWMRVPLDRTPQAPTRHSTAHYRSSGASDWCVGYTRWPRVPRLCPLK